MVTSGRGRRLREEEALYWKAAGEELGDYLPSPLDRGEPVADRYSTGSAPQGTAFLMAR